VDAGVLQSRWADVLEAVKAERKVAWILLEKATVAGLDGGVLTLSFANEGYARGFASSGYDADLSRVLKAMFGISPQIRGVSGPAAAAGATTRPRGAAPASPGGPSRPARSGDRGGHGDASSYDYAPPDGPDDDDPGDYRGPPRGGAPSAKGAGASATRKAAHRGAASEGGGSGAPGPSRGGSRSRAQPGSGNESRPQAARDPDDLAAEESATGQDASQPGGAPGSESLSGLDLIQRELGGKIIDEFGSD
jgi:DNA polymerase-3 subunit gamma/tau